MEKKNVIAIIPARKGSKRLKNKNLLKLNGKPLIQWTIDESKKAKSIDELIVSTDSELVMTISEENGVDVPFLRPDEFSNDSATSIDVIFHALEFFKNKGVTFRHCMLLQPTSPLRSYQDIEEAFRLIDGNTLSVVSVCEVEHSPIWSNTLPEDMSMKDFIPEEAKNKRSQDLPKHYRLNGAIYVANVDYLYANNGFIGSNTKAFLMPKERSIDIDDELDFLIAQEVQKKMLK